MRLTRTKKREKLDEKKKKKTNVFIRFYQMICTQAVKLQQDWARGEESRKIAWGGEGGVKEMTYMRRGRGVD